MKLAVNQHLSDLWAITCYFNPLGYRRKLENYRLFRQRLAAPLIALELGYGSDFELRDGDADILLQLRGEDVLWQKERLLNLALRRLPTGCGKVAWLDCDVIFESDDWAQRTSRLLERYEIVQLFRRLYRTPMDWAPGDDRETGVVRHSVPFLIASGMQPAECLRLWSEQVESATGCAWAARRELLEEHGLYDAFVIGGGDGAICRAAYGCFDEMIRLCNMNDRQTGHYLTWARPFYEAVRGNVGFVEGDIFHLWHGDQSGRRYHSRWDGLRLHRFDPFVDIAVDREGVWRWNSGKTEMHAYVRSYFQARREDGEARANP